MKELINIREANQHLSRYVDAVQDGAEIIITRRGRPVAKLTGIQESRGLTEGQDLARKRSLARMRKGYSLGGNVPRRDILHER
jgi:prevent-host-death family protein